VIVGLAYLALAALGYLVYRLGELVLAGRRARAAALILSATRF